MQAAGVAEPAAERLPAAHLAIGASLDPHVTGRLHLIAAPVPTAAIGLQLLAGPIHPTGRRKIGRAHV